MDVSYDFMIMGVPTYEDVDSMTAAIEQAIFAHNGTEVHIYPTIED